MTAVLRAEEPSAGHRPEFARADSRCGGVCGLAGR